MCGRFAFTLRREEIVREFGVAEVPPLQCKYNISPGQDILAIRLSGSTKEAIFLHWGLIPSWAKDRNTGYRMINARAESVLSKPAFKRAFEKRRCLIPVSGFFEWQKTQSGKQPWYIRPKEKNMLVFAGLWEKWESRDGGVVESCTIITVQSNELLAPIHDRMPAILERTNYDTWLSGKIDEALSILRPLEAAKLEAYPVSKKVNYGGYDSPDCIRPVNAEGPQRSLFR